MTTVENGKMPLLSSTPHFMSYWHWHLTRQRHPTTKATRKNPPHKAPVKINQMSNVHSSSLNKFIFVSFSCRFQAISKAVSVFRERVRLMHIRGEGPG